MRLLKNSFIIVFLLSLVSSCDNIKLDKYLKDPNYPILNYSMEMKKFKKYGERIYYLYAAENCLQHYQNSLYILYCINIYGQKDKYFKPKYLSNIVLRDFDIVDNKIFITYSNVNNTRRFYQAKMAFLDSDGQIHDIYNFSIDTNLYHDSYISHSFLHRENDGMYFTNISDSLVSVVKYDLKDNLIKEENIYNKRNNQFVLPVLQINKILEYLDIDDFKTLKNKLIYYIVKNNISGFKKPELGFYDILTKFNGYYITGGIDDSINHEYEKYIVKLDKNLNVGKYTSIRIDNKKYPYFYEQRPESSIFQIDSSKVFVYGKFTHVNGQKCSSNGVVLDSNLNIISNIDLKQTDKSIITQVYLENLDTIYICTINKRESAAFSEISRLIKIKTLNDIFVILPNKDQLYFLLACLVGHILLIYYLIKHKVFFRSTSTTSASASIARRRGAS
jgi:hypothetical protein